MAKRLTDIEVGEATDDARKAAGFGDAAIIAVGYEPWADGAEIVFWRNGKRLGGVTLSPADALQLIMAWDTKRDVMLGRLCFFPNVDGSLVLALLRKPGGKTLTSTTLPPPDADRLTDQMVLTGGYGLGLALSVPKGGSMTPIVIELPGEPKGKGRPRFTRNGVTFTPPKTRSYEASLAWTAAAAMKGAKPLEGPLTLAVEAHMPIPASWSGKRQRMAAAGDIRPTTRPDYDNVLKALDGLNGIVWRDDAQIVDVRCTKLYSERPRLRITVEVAAP
jgi:Holliday junction resolvase RusA-like endonuclease